MKFAKMLLVTPQLLILLLAACGSANENGVSGTPITAVQGTGPASPMAGESVTVVGIVTGDFQDNDDDTTNNLGGFYLQQPNVNVDAEASAGIFVFDGNRHTVDVKVGDKVEVTGTVAEFFGETQIAEPTVSITGNGVIQPTDIRLPSAELTMNSNGDPIANLERYEGMLVRFPQQLSVTDLNSLERFGEVGLSQGGRLFQYTNSHAPGASGYSAHTESNAARFMMLDDGLRSMNPAAIRHLNAGTATDYSIRAGDTVTAITGNLRYARGSGGSGDETWRLMPTGSPTFEDTNPRPGRPEVGGAIRIASFNVLNFFPTIDSGDAVCGPESDDNCRGADSEIELSRQLKKTVSALEFMDADVIGLIELENNASTSLSTIVATLNAKIGVDDYAYVETGTIHDDAIKTGFVYRSSTMQLAGSFALLDSRIDTRFDDERNRPALAQSFVVRSTGAIVTVVVNHLKSKGSSCSSDGDPNRSDGQGNCSVTRTNAAVALADWAASDPTGIGDRDVLVIGDLNAYSAEDPLAALEAAGLVSLLRSSPEPYSYVFDAQAGALDHALATASLAPQVVEAIEWHINADEPRLLDYNLDNGRDPNLFDASTPYRVSDHDPVVIGLDLSN